MVPERNAEGRCNRLATAAAIASLAYQVVWPKRGCWATIIVDCAARGLEAATIFRFGCDFEVIFG